MGSLADIGQFVGGVSRGVQPGISARIKKNEKDEARNLEQLEEEAEADVRLALIKERDPEAHKLLQAKIDSGELDKSAVARTPASMLKVTLSSSEKLAQAKSAVAGLEDPPRNLVEEQQADILSEESKKLSDARKARASFSASSDAKGAKKSPKVPSVEGIPSAELPEIPEGMTADEVREQAVSQARTEIAAGLKTLKKVLSTPRKGGGDPFEELLEAANEGDENAQQFLRTIGFL